jgi:hypothetical protein
MKALKAAWERAPIGRQKDIAFKNYEAAQRSNAARMEKSASAHLHKVEAALK